MPGSHPLLLFCCLAFGVGVGDTSSLKNTEVKMIRGRAILIIISSNLWDVTFGPCSVSSTSSSGVNVIGLISQMSHEFVSYHKETSCSHIIITFWNCNTYHARMARRAQQL